MTSNVVLEETSKRAPMCVAVDARMLAPRPTGVGNYMASLLAPLCRQQSGTRFILYSNSRVEFESHSNVSVRQWGSRYGPAWLQYQVPLAMAEDGVDVFWGANGVSPVFSSRPTVVTVHDLVYRFAGETMSWKSRWTKRMFQGWSARKASRVTAVSQATAHDVATVYRRQVDDVILPTAHHVYHRRDPATALQTVERLGLADAYWLFAGTLEPRKNLVALLEAHEAVAESGITLPMLVLAGAVGWGTSRLNELIKRGEGQGRIRRLGYLPSEDLACLYAACGAFWMPSLYEGFGMPLLEAQCCGAPVIHGPHASMEEAAAGLGVRTEIDVPSLASTMRAICRGEAPLACRLVRPPSHSEQSVRAERLWDAFCSAHGERIARPRSASPINPPDRSRTR